MYRLASRLKDKYVVEQTTLDSKVEGKMATSKGCGIRE